MTERGSYLLFGSITGKHTLNDDGTWTHEYPTAPRYRRPTWYWRIWWWIGYHSGIYAISWWWQRRKGVLPLTYDEIEMRVSQFYAEDRKLQRLYTAPDPEYTCGAAYCDDPACRTHNPDAAPC